MKKQIEFLKTAKNIICIVVGDASGDGHDKRESFLIKTNVSDDDLELIYKAGAKKLGIDITLYCQEYEDRSIPDEIAVKLLSRDINKHLSNDLEFCTYSKKYTINSEQYMDIWLFIAKAGNEQLKAKIVNEKTDGYLTIGGYGLYY